jgi:hypothetical protein
MHDQMPIITPVHVQLKNPALLLTLAYLPLPPPVPLMSNSIPDLLVTLAE